MQKSPLARAPLALKRRFVRSGAGRLVARVVAEEGRYLAEWKRCKIVEAAGADFDAAAAQRRLDELAATADVVVFSFSDCPWCVAAKDALELELGDSIGWRAIELDELGVEGKQLRAALALATDRTSLPNCFVRGASIGGFTDGRPRGVRARPKEDGLQRRVLDGTLLEAVRTADWGDRAPL